MVMLSDSHTDFTLPFPVVLSLGLPCYTITQINYMVKPLFHNKAPHTPLLQKRIQVSIFILPNSGPNDKIYSLNKLLTSRLNLLINLWVFNNCWSICFYLQHQPGTLLIIKKIGDLLNQNIIKKYQTFIVSLYSIKVCFKN